MSREQRYQAIVLKKQPYGEGDEIITFFTLEEGKLRAMAKSTKYAKSKLQYSLQTLFAVNLTVSGSGLVKIIGAESVSTFPKIRESLEAAQVAFYALELALKFTPDEQKNEVLYELLLNFFGFLNGVDGDTRLLNLGLAKFKIQFLEAVGLSVAFPPSAPGDLYFSNSKGSFLSNAAGADHIPVSQTTFTQFGMLREGTFDGLPHQAGNEAFVSQNTIELQEILSGFLKYHLERDIKSERYLGVL